MFLNSVHEQCPNSDPKQCTVKKLGWVHSAHTQNPGRAHTARAVPMSWAYWACTCCDTPRQPAPRSRPHFDVATSRKPKSCRDIKSMSRHHSERSRSRPQNGVATPNLLSPIHPSRDVHFLSRPQADQTRSRPQIFFFFPGHNMNFMSRPRTLLS